MPKKLTQRKVSLPTMQRAASLEPKTINEENRTVDVVWTKGSRVRRGFFNTYYEELGLEKKNVRMGRLKSGSAPVLDSHGYDSRGGLNSVLGVVISAELIPGKEGRATLKFSSRDEVEPLFRDIKDGILRNISVGYNVYKMEKVEETDDVAVYRAIDWEPVEISVVAAGADPEARIRSEEKDERKNDCVFVDPSSDDEQENETRSNDENLENENLENENGVAKPNESRDTQDIGGNEMTPEEKRELEEKARKEGIEAEKKRAAEIRLIVRKLKLGDDVAEKFIDDGTPADEVRTKAIDLVAERDEKEENQIESQNESVSVGTDLARKGRIEGMTSALLHKYRPQAEEKRSDSGQLYTMPGYKLSDSGRNFAYFSLLDMARACLEANNVRTGMMPKHAIVDAVLNNYNVRGGYHSTSDFTEILANVANKTLRDGYQAAPQTFMPFVNEVFVTDFKQISRTNLGDAPKLEKLAEGSEVKRGSISEAAEKYQVEEYAKVIALTRKTIINDDLGAFTRLPERMGRRAKDLESDTVWDIIKANAALADTFALFSAQHSNLSTAAAAPSEAGLNEARAAMRRQVGLDGAEISLIPAFTIVPPAHETAMEKLLATTRPNNASDVNPFGPQGRTTLRMDVEPRLETGTGGSLTAWFVFADKRQSDMVELARLEGTNGPQMQSRDGFDVNGMELKIMHDIGAKAIDFRGMFKNAGA